MSQQPETQVSPVVPGPASLPGPGGEFVPAANSDMAAAPGGKKPAASGVTPAANDLTAAKSDLTPTASSLTPAKSDLTPAASDLTPAGPPSAGRHSEPPPPERIPRWLVQTELFVRVMLQIFIGLIVFCAPWWEALWDHNPVFLRFPIVGAIALNGAVRGVISGLGLLNLWIAFQYALRREGD